MTEPCNVYVQVTERHVRLASLCPEYLNPVRMALEDAIADTDFVAVTDDDEVFVKFRYGPEIYSARLPRLASNWQADWFENRTVESFSLTVTLRTGGDAP